MKKVMKVLMCVVMFFVLVGCSNESDTTKKVAVVKLVDHTSLNTIEDAITKGLEEDENIEIIYKNANGDTSLLPTIMEQLKAEGVDVIVAITTPVAQVAATVATDIPVVFSAVTDPVAANLVTELEVTDKNITGTSDALALDKIVELMQETYPQATNIGFLYNTGEVNSVASLEKIMEITEGTGLEIIPIGITNSSEINSALLANSDKIDILFSPNDNTIASAMSVVSQITKEEKIPMFTGADSMVSDGGLMTYGIDYEDLGTESAIMVKSILDGTSVSDIPVKVFNEDLTVYVNQSTADAVGFTGIEKLQESYEVIIIE